MKHLVTCKKVLSPLKLELEIYQSYFLPKNNEKKS
jgi:hypothetical protein